MSQDGGFNAVRMLIATLNHHESQAEEVNPPPPSHCITDSVAGYHHIKLVLMNTSESTEERDNQTFIKCLNLLYMHNVMEREMGL